MKYLIIAAHPDDEVLGCGGSIAKWSRSGAEVHILIMAEGATSRDKSRNRLKRKNEILSLAQSADKACEILGAKSIKLLNFPDNRMDSVDLLDVIKDIESHIRKIKPEVIVTHHSGDLNIDHQVIHKAVITASRPQPGHFVKRILSFEVPSSTEWNTHSSSVPFVPNYFEDITDTLKLKIQALEAYESEMREWPHSRSIKATKHLAKWRGASVGFKSAEAFILLRQLNS